MERPLLNDEKQYPDDDVLGAHLGRTKPVWDAFVARLAGQHPDISLEWRYYNDGKAWLCKVVRKKKTVCWVSIWQRFFKTGFYFTAKSDKDIQGLPIPQDLKDAYRASKTFGTLKPMTVDVKSKKALDAVFVLVSYKIGLK